MKTKRPTPKKLPSGAWRCQVMVDGQRISVTDEDKNICQSKAMAIQAGLMEKEERKKAITLEQAIDAYIANKSTVLSPSTVRGYEGMKKHRFKGIMSRNIYTLTKKDIQIAVNQETKEVSAKTIANAYGLVRPVLREYGVDVFGVKLPQQVRQKKKYLQPDEIGKLLEAAQGDSCEVAIIMAVWLGLRRSEIIGLCWDCVDEEAKTVTIRRTVVPDKNNKMVLKEGAKNESSQRTIHCPDHIMEKLATIRNGRTSGQVFHIHPDTLRRHIHKACEAAGITDTTVHGLRHTNAAVMRHLGVSDAHAMERGGWSNESTYKKTYSYVFESAALTEDRVIDQFFTEVL